MNETIFKINPDDEFYFEEGCHIIELSNSENDPAVSIAAYEEIEDADQETTTHRQSPV